MWLTLSDSVLVDFADIEPKRIGTVVMRPCGPGFVAQPGHLDWLRYEEREARLLGAVVRLYPARESADPSSPPHSSGTLRLSRMPSAQWRIS